MHTMTLFPVLSWLVTAGLTHAASMLASSLAKPIQRQTTQTDYTDQLAFECVYGGSCIYIGTFVCRFNTDKPTTSATPATSTQPIIQMVYQAVESMLAKLDDQHPAKAWLVDKCSCWIGTTMLRDLDDSQFLQLLASQAGPVGPAGRSGQPYQLILTDWVLDQQLAELAKSTQYGVYGLYGVYGVYGVLKTFVCLCTANTPN